MVDDNDLLRLTLHQLALQTGRLQVTGECKDAIKDHRNITANPPDLVLLDIEMPGITRIELLKILPKQTLAILTTLKKDYAVEAFDLNVGGGLAYCMYYA
jgi:DNA-binding NarL/FixJ family response regulator